MFLALSLIDPIPVVAYVSGWLIAAGVVLFGLLAIYAIYWIIFKMGK